MPIPRVAIVGRPNVGKSSLVNMIAAEKIAIVDSVPGVTRDRLSVVVDLPVPLEKANDPDNRPRPLEITDTGGYGVYVAEGGRYDEVGADLATLTDDIEEQIAAAVASADLILFAVDVQAGITAQDWDIAKMLREQKLGRRDRGGSGELVPVRVIATKVDGESWETHAYELSGLGFDEPLMCSATTNFMRRKLLDQLWEITPETEVTSDDSDHGMKVAIVGKRNVGKSTLVNKLAGKDRVIVSEIAGTTRDAIDVRIDLEDGRRITAIDTAGQRRKKSFQGRVEWFAFDRAQRAIERADVVLLVLDADREISQVDEQLAQLVVESLKPVIVVVNKWDLAEGQVGTKGRAVRVDDYEDYVRRELKGLDFAPMAMMSARDGLNVDEVTNLAFELHEQSSNRIGTGELNRVLAGILSRQSPASKAGKHGRLYFASQVKSAPPT
ncbi:MAG: ribosome biogenesis GTPase Der, partial [Planctomycetota bacterium]